MSKVLSTWLQQINTLLSYREGSREVLINNTETVVEYWQAVYYKDIEILNSTDNQREGVKSFFHFFDNVERTKIEQNLAQVEQDLFSNDFALHLLSPQKYIRTYAILRQQEIQKEEAC